MKKFTFKGVLDGFRSSVQAAPRGVEQEIQETLRPDHFQIKKVSRRFYRALRPKVPQIMALAMSSARLGSGAGRCTVERLRLSRGDSGPEACCVHSAASARTKTIAVRCVTYLSSLPKNIGCLLRAKASSVLTSGLNLDHVLRWL